MSAVEGREICCGRPLCSTELLRPRVLDSARSGGFSSQLKHSTTIPTMPTFVTTKDVPKGTSRSRATGLSLSGRRARCRWRRGFLFFILAALLTPMKQFLQSLPGTLVGHSRASKSATAGVMHLGWLTTGGGNDSRINTHKQLYRCCYAAE